MFGHHPFAGAGRDAPVDAPRIVVVQLAPQSNDLLAEAMLAKAVLTRSLRQAPCLFVADRGKDHVGFAGGDDARLLEQAERKASHDMDPLERLAPSTWASPDGDERTLGAGIEPIDVPDAPALLSFQAIVNLDRVARAVPTGVPDADLYCGGTSRENV